MSANLIHEPSLTRSIHPAAAAAAAVEAVRRGLLFSENHNFKGQLTVCHAVISASLTESHHYATNSICWLDLRNRLSSPPNMALMGLRFPWPWG